MSDLRFLGFPDGVVEYGLPLRRAIAAEIRRFRPDTVVTASFRESWPNGMLNQADHIAVGRAVVDATRDAGNRWVFTDLVDAGLEPWNGVVSLLALGSPSPTHAIDVTKGFDAGVQSLRAHEAYLAGLGSGGPDPGEMLGMFLGETGQQVGVRYALAAEVFPLQLW